MMAETRQGKGRIKRAFIKWCKAFITLGMPVVICVSLAAFRLGSAVKSAMMGLIFLWLEIEMVWGRDLRL
jgi:hypothetical protein